MVRFQRKGRVRAGKYPEALTWAKEISSIVGSAGAQTVAVWSEVFDDVQAIYWHADFESIAEVEQMRNSLLGHGGYQNLIGRAGELLIDGSLEDTLLTPA
jgi:hypothetical protein